MVLWPGSTPSSVHPMWHDTVCWHEALFVALFKSLLSDLHHDEASALLSHRQLPVPHRSAAKTAVQQKPRSVTDFQIWMFSIITPVFSVTWSFRNQSNIYCSFYYQYWNRDLFSVFFEYKVKKHHLFEMEIFCNFVNVFVTFKSM